MIAVQRHCFRSGQSVDCWNQVLKIQTILKLLRLRLTDVPDHDVIYATDSLLKGDLVSFSMGAINDLNFVHAGHFWCLCDCV